jgi:hypothetical protein
VIAGAASKRRGKLGLPDAVAVHPVAIKYLLQTEVEASLQGVLDEIESRFCWQRQNLSLVERIVRVGEALLALKELEYLGKVQTGEIDERLESLINYLLGRLEAKWLSGKRQFTFLGRVKSLRAAILKDMLAGELSTEERETRWHDLADIYLAIQLSSYPPRYVRSNPTPERLTETVERFEEDTTDKARIHGRWRVILQVGKEIRISSSDRRSHECLTNKLQEEAIRQMLDAIHHSREAPA